MKRDVNVGLLLLIMAALLMFSGFTVYYQTSFKNLSTTYHNELKELERVTSDLESKRSLLNDTSTQLQLKKQKEEDLSKKFTDVRSEKEQLETDKKKLEVELANTKSDLASTNAKLAQTQNQLTTEIQLVQDLNTQVLNLKSDVDKFEALYKNYQNKYNCVANRVDANGNPC